MSSPASSGPGARSPCSSSRSRRGRLPRAAWEAYVRAGLPLAGRAVSPGWAEVGGFLGPSIRDFWDAGRRERLRGVWDDAGIEDVQARLLSLGGGIVMWGARGD